MKNHGKLAFKNIIIEGRPYGQPYLVETGELWKDVAPPPEAGTYFIVAIEGGYIISAELDPMQSLITGYDILEIEHAGPSEAIRGKMWNGSEVVDLPPEEETT